MKCYILRVHFKPGMGTFQDYPIWEDEMDEMMKRINFWQAQTHVFNRFEVFYKI